jgi:ketosteroid isomerase-like protein
VPEETIDLVRRGLDAFNRRDLTTALALWRSDGEIDWSRSQGPLKGIHRGHQGLEAFWMEFWSAFEEIEVEIHELTQIDSRVVVVNTAHLRGRDGIEVTATSTFLYTVEDGFLVRLEMFQEQAEAVEAARGAE